MSSGECVVLAREGDPYRPGDSQSNSGDEGIRCIVSMDDEYVWSSTGDADVKRWRDVGRRISRLNDDDDGVAYDDRRNGDVSINVPTGLGMPMSVTNKRSSLDSAPDIQTSLLGTESRESRSIAFAPAPHSRSALEDPFAEPSSQYSPSRLPAKVRDRLNPPSQRRSTPSGALIAGSFVSDSSANFDDVANPVPPRSLTMNGLPYESLVCLGLPDSPYSFGFSFQRQDDLERMRSNGSVSSGPTRPNNFLKPDGGDVTHRGSALLEREQTQAQMTRMEFEDREVAAEGTPLRKQPDDVIAGRSGLVRCLLLNDRQHVLSVDTDGEVAAWDIIRGVCVGRFSTADVAAALDLERGVKAATAVRKHSQEVLELVKERVEGETMVITWCQVDTKIGSLVVHLEEGRVFDAEVYADGMDMEGMEGMKEDARSGSSAFTAHATAADGYGSQLGQMGFGEPLPRSDSIVSRVS